MPSIWIMLVLLFLAALAFIWLWLNERRRQKKETPPQEETTTTETSEGGGDEGGDGKKLRSLIKKLMAAPGRTRHICRLIARPERAKDEKGLLRLLPFFLTEKRQILKALILIGITAFCTLMFGVFARVLPRFVDGTAMLLALLAGITIAVNTLGVFSTLLGQKILTRWSGNVAANINGAATRSALDARYEKLLQPETAEVVNGSQTAQRQDLMNALNNGAFPILSGMVSLSAAVVACLITNWSVSSIIFVLLVLCARHMFRSDRSLGKLFDQRRKVLGEENVALGHAKSLPAIQDWKAGGRDYWPLLSNYNRRWRVLSIELTVRSQRAAVPTNIVTGSISPIIFLLMALMQMVGMVGKVSASDILAMLTQISILSAAIMRITSGFYWMPDLRSALKGFAAMLDLEPEPAPSDPAALTPADPANRIIRFNGVRYTYPGAEEPVIEDVSCEIGPHDFVSVIGRSGKGKSTVAQILAGLLHPQEGEVWCGEHDLHALEAAIRGKLVAYMGQQAPPFHGTIREEFLARWCDATDEEIEQILGHTGLWEELQEKKGLETPASSLSGGQKQRLHFALIDFKVERNGPMILIIDEGTSDLDPVAEMLVVGRMNTRAEGGSTVIQVAHRGPAIDAGNRILALKGGVGTLMTIEEARRDPRSLYYRLVWLRGRLKRP